MKSPLRLFRPHTGLWVVRELVQTLKDIRTELVLIRCLQEELARRPTNAGTTVQIGGQGFITSRPDGGVHIETTAEEPGGVDYNSNEELARYELVNQALWKVLGRQPTTEEIEHERLLRFEP
jgi:hypothetical protein